MVDRNPRAAAEQLEQVVELARKHGIKEIIGHALAVKAAAHARLGEFDAAEAAAEEALAAADSGGHRVKEADVNIFLAAAYYDMGDLERGLEHARIGAQLADEENAPECACAGFYVMGMGNLERKELSEALAYFARSKHLADSSGWRAYVSRIRGGAALAELGQGVGEALDELETALANARADHDDYAVGVLSQRLALAYLERGQPDRGEPHLNDALAYYREAGMKPYEASALDLAARLYGAQGRTDKAAEAQASAEIVRSAIQPVRTPVGVGASPTDTTDRPPSS